jgi:hypothetical protein
LNYLPAVTFRTSHEGRSTHSVRREPLGLKRSVRCRSGEIPSSHAGGSSCIFHGQKHRYAFSDGRSVKDLRKTGFQARTFQGFQLRPEPAEVLVIDEASLLSVPQMLWLVKYACENGSRVLLVGDSAQHRSIERGDAAYSRTVRFCPGCGITPDPEAAGA